MSLVEHTKLARKVFGTVLFRARGPMLGRCASFLICAALFFIFSAARSSFGSDNCAGGRQYPSTAETADCSLFGLRIVPAIGGLNSREVVARVTPIAAGYDLASEKITSIEGFPLNLSFRRSSLTQILVRLAPASGDPSSNLAFTIPLGVNTSIDSLIIYTHPAAVAYIRRGNLILPATAIGRSLKLFPTFPSMKSISGHQLREELGAIGLIATPYGPATALSPDLNDDATAYSWLLTRDNEAKAVNLTELSRRVRDRLESKGLKFDFRAEVSGPQFHEAFVGSRFVARIRSDFLPEVRNNLSLAASIGPLNYQSSLFVISFDSFDPIQHIGTLDALVRAGLVDTYEPDLSSTLSDQSSVTAFHNDPRFAEQYEFFAIQGFLEAKEFIRSRPKPPGRAPLVISVIDNNFTFPPLRDFNCNVSTEADTWPKLAGCWNIFDGRECFEGQYRPDPTSRHGDAVASLIGACADNELDIAGLALGARLRLIHRPHDTNDVDYSRLLMWTAGVEIPACEDSPACGWEPLSSSSRARVVNGSHNMNVLRDIPDPYTVPLAISDAIHLSSVRTDGTPGTLFVYAAGASAFPKSVNSSESFGKHPAAMAASDCMMSLTGAPIPTASDCPGAGTNCSPGASLCALGYRSPVSSIFQASFSNLPPHCGPSAPNPVSMFRGTSAATAIVSAAASLVFEANDSLSPKQVKDLLVETAHSATVPTAKDYGTHSRYCFPAGSGLLDVFHAVCKSVGGHLIDETTVRRCSLDP